MNTVNDVEQHERYASLTVIALRNALERITPNHHDMCLMVGLLETWFDQCAAADYSEQSELTATLWASMQEVYAVSPEQRAEDAKASMKEAA